MEWIAFGLGALMASPFLIIAILFLVNIAKRKYIMDKMLELEQDGRGGEFHDKQGGTLRLLPVDRRVTRDCDCGMLLIPDDKGWMVCPKHGRPK